MLKSGHCTNIELIKYQWNLCPFKSAFHVNCAIVLLFFSSSQFIRTFDGFKETTTSLLRCVYVLKGFQRLIAVVIGRDVTYLSGMIYWKIRHISARFSDRKGTALFRSGNDIPARVSMSLLYMCNFCY